MALYVHAVSFYNSVALFTKNQENKDKNRSKQNYKLKMVLYFFGEKEAPMRLFLTKFSKFKDKGSRIRFPTILWPMSGKRNRYLYLEILNTVAPWSIFSVTMYFLVMCEINYIFNNMACGLTMLLFVESFNEMKVQKR